MATNYTAAMPPNTGLAYGCTVQFVAVDPVTGDAVSGVNVSNASIYVESGGEGAQLASGPFMLVPGPGA